MNSSSRFADSHCQGHCSISANCPLQPASIASTPASARLMRLRCRGWLTFKRWMDIRRRENGGRRPSGHGSCQFIRHGAHRVVTPCGERPVPAARASAPLVRHNLHEALSLLLPLCSLFSLLSRARAPYADQKIRCKRGRSRLLFLQVYARCLSFSSIHRMQRVQRGMCILVARARSSLKRRLAIPADSPPVGNWRAKDKRERGGARRASSGARAENETNASYVVCALACMGRRSMHRCANPRLRSIPRSEATVSTVESLERLQLLSSNSSSELARVVVVARAVHC